VEKFFNQKDWRPERWGSRRVALLDGRRQTKIPPGSGSRLLTLRREHAFTPAANASRDQVAERIARERVARRRGEFCRQAKQTPRLSERSVTNGARAAPQPYLPREASEWSKGVRSCTSETRLCEAERGNRTDKERYHGLRKERGGGGNKKPASGDDLRLSREDGVSSQAGRKKGQPRQEN